MTSSSPNSNIIKVRGPFTPTITVSDKVWNIEERMKVSEGLTAKMGYKRFHHISKHVKTKTNNDVRQYVSSIKRIEENSEVAQFLDKAPLDVWIDLVNSTTLEADSSAKNCIPQVMTVASHETGNQPLSTDEPNYAMVYEFLSIILKGEEPPELPAKESKVVLCLLEDLIKKLSMSDTHSQSVQLHTTYEQLKPYLLQNLPEKYEEIASTDGELRRFPSLNPLGIPHQLLNFKWKTQML